MRDITKFANLSNKELEESLAKLTVRIVNMQALTEDEEEELKELTDEAQQRGLI